jgi:glycosyltransferase involved in cell wall biosynthesis
MITVQAIGSPGLGGAERFFSRLATRLAGRGHPTVAVLRRGAELGSLLGPEVEVVETGMRNGIDVRTWWTIRRLLLSRRPHIIQTYLGRASRLTRVPRGSGTVHVARLGGYYRPNSYRHADLWIGNTRGICDHLVRSGFPADRVHHITNLVEPAANADRLPHELPSRDGTDVPADASLIFALGRFVSRKGFGDLLRAFALLPASIGGRIVHLAIAGDGVLREDLETEADQLGIRQRVHFPGWLTDPDPWFRAADLVVCPSRDEALGNVVLEAWSHARPLVCTRTAGPVELVTDGLDGILVAVGAPEELALTLQRLLPDHGRREELARAGLETARRRHSPEVVVDAYLDLYREATRRG